MNSLVIRNGVFMFVGFTGFFLIMHALNLSQHYHLRILNGVIHLTFITIAIRQFQRREPLEFENYLPAVAIGVVTSMIGVTLFAIFQLIYLAVNDAFMQQLQTNIPYVGQYLTPFTSALTIFMEGLAVSVIGSYVVTRLIDASMNKHVKVNHG